MTPSISNASVPFTIVRYPLLSTSTLIQTIFVILSPKFYTFRRPRKKLLVILRFELYVPDIHLKGTVARLRSVAWLATLMDTIHLDTP